jgi:transcriptional regulator with XRE-family HTH domain
MTPQELKRWREKADLTQEKLAKHLGLSTNTISRYEQGSRRIGKFIPLVLAVLRRQLAKKVP